MAKLKFEIDTDEIYTEFDYEGQPIDGNSFESLVRNAIGKEVKVEMQSKFSGEAFVAVSKNIALECVYQVDKKLRSLINEDVVMQDRWGNPEFIGTVEDYLKKTIDEKILRSVDGNGKTIEGCSKSSDKTTWIEWIVEDTIKRSVTKTTDRSLKNAEYYAEKVIKAKVEEFKNKTLNRLITEKLEAVGAN